MGEHMMTQMQTDTVVLALRLLQQAKLGLVMVADDAGEPWVAFDEAPRFKDFEPTCTHAQIEHLVATITGCDRRKLPTPDSDGHMKTKED